MFELLAGLPSLGVSHRALLCRSALPQAYNGAFRQGVSRTNDVHSNLVGLDRTRLPPARKAICPDLRPGSGGTVVEAERW